MNGHENERLFIFTVDSLRNRDEANSKESHLIPEPVGLALVPDSAFAF
jgi:hypothetical protein